ncbi:MAG: type II toxin-antitoxin system RelE/ParE family toxin [Schwartzia sp.]|nr:type II toxin-antitoxin system RelE/ParE family toxin [Schwartzia sp. (in: firmicutes)]
MFQIEFFETDDGKRPIGKFLDSLDKKMRAKIVRNLKHLQANGPNTREPLSAPLGDKLFELRTQLGNDITRVIYFFYVGHTIVLTHGFVKKTQKTPPSEISRAKLYRKMYLERKEHENNG